MTTRDAFLDALTIAPAKPARHDYGPSIGVGPAMRPTSPHPDSPIARARAEIPKSLPPRPDFADDIDRIVAEMIESGQVVFDAQTQSFKAPPRRWRFAT